MTDNYLRLCPADSVSVNFFQLSNLGFLPLAFNIQHCSQFVEGHESESAGVSRFFQGQFEQGHDCSGHIALDLGDFDARHFLLHLS